MSNRKFLAIWLPVLSFVLILAVAVNILSSYFKGYVDLFLGRGEIQITKVEGSENWDTEYYKLDYSNAEEVKTAADEMVETVEGEGIVLLKNNDVLPLSGGKVTLFGRDSADPIYGGSGSGSVDLSSAVNFKTGLEHAGFSVNEPVYSILEQYASFTESTDARGSAVKTYEHPRANIAMDDPSASTWYIGEMPVENYAGAEASFTEWPDAAIVIFGRGGGEGGDLAQDMEGFDENYEAGQHQLELNFDEKQTLALAEAHFDTVVVVINSSNVMELGDLQNDENVDAILWIGAPGQTGFNAVGEVLSGNINPSGRTSDIYPADLTKDPTFANFGDFRYSNIGSGKSGDGGYYVQYEEGIYVGYRYYETAAVEGALDYEKAVVYPFGYGLGYTDFSWEVTGQALDEDHISVSVEVTNTGDVAGKDVVQLYYSAPWEQGGIEKSSVVLGDFAKTKMLAPGEAETLTLSFATETMASYDYKGEKAYVLEEGDYEIRLQTDSHNVKDGAPPLVYTVDSTAVLDGAANRFDDVSAMFADEAENGFALNMSRADFTGTFPTAPAASDKIANDDIVAGYQEYVAADHLDEAAKMPATGEDNGLQLIDLRGVDYDDPLWDDLLDEIAVEDMMNVFMNGAYTSFPIPGIGKPQTVDYDGPSGISSYMTELSCTAYPSEVVIASTWNTDLAAQIGEILGNEALANDVNGWYAPGVNIHRSQFGGRNFEYYSEDGLLSGKIAAACISGAAEKGLYAFIKHFALNEQETNRVNNGVSTWANEQAIREIYLKPFEIAVRSPKTTVKYISGTDGAVSEKEMNACTAVMSSFNRIGATWAGGSSALMTDVLRGEWGFEGMSITDFNLYPYMSPDQGLAAGSDLMLTYQSMKDIDDTSSATAVTRLRAATKNILYTVVNSNAMNGIAAGTVISYTTAPWQIGLYIADGVIGVLLIVGCVFVIRRVRRHSKA
ncbi:MAG: glycoside hydrolase family 3 C-terminal domain-containing protein [Clostridiales Family XIII bacterium]|nr:glycoside hydrolase family 3 C-terminal domain-containing protein [Clostridiales Family XIII bacterium]